MGDGGPRATGARLGYAGVPEHVRAWIVARFGLPVRVTDHVGGMSPGCATSLFFETADAVFVKAVGREINEGTFALFEFERDLLFQLPTVDYRPVLVDSYETAGWAALAFENIDGRYPRFDDQQDFEAVRDVIVRQVRELSPPPPSARVPGMAEKADHWIARWTELATLRPAVVPEWVWANFDALLTRVQGLGEHVPSQALCHFDIRDDNVLIRPDGSAVIVDWGMARTGPEWVDLVQVAVQMSDPTRAASEVLNNVSSANHAAATTFVLASAGSQAWNGEQHWHTTLPKMRDFAREDAARLFAVAQQLL